MPLRRTPLLVEAAPARKSEQGRGIGNEPIGFWGRASSASGIRIPAHSRSFVGWESARPSSSRGQSASQAATKPQKSRSLTRSFLQRVKSKAQEVAGRVSKRLKPSPPSDPAVERAKERMGVWGKAKGHEEISATHRSAASRAQRTGREGHEAINAASMRTHREKAKETWSGYKPEIKKKHPEEADWAHKMRQHADDVKKVHGHKELHIIGPRFASQALGPDDFHFSSERPHPSNSSLRVFHTASVAFARTALLSESLPDPKQAPPIAHSRTVEARIKAHIKAGNAQVAEKLKNQLRMRKELHKTLSAKQETPESGAATLTTRAQRWGRNTKQRNVSGATTQQLRATQTMTVPPRPRKAGSTTVVSTPIPETPRTIPHKREDPRRITQRLRVPQSDSMGLGRTPLLTELVTKAVGGSPGGVFATGLKPGSPITSHPRDQRDLPIPPRKGGAVTTRDVGHTANTGAWVPDKKRRDIKPPKSKIPKGVWDPITKELEAQPSNSGGILTVIRPRTRLLGG